MARIPRRRFIQASAATTVVLANAKAVPVLAQTGGNTTVAKYILSRLRQHGAELLFGVPGATCDPLFAATGSGKDTLAPLVTASDLEAGYAADGYARVRGLGALSVTYGVGTMSLLCVIGGAYAERSPLVVINGGPSGEDLRIQRETGCYFTHSIGRDKTDLTVFKEVTAYAERADRPSDVPKVVDAAIKTVLTQQRPVYIEISKDMWDSACAAPSAPIDVSIPASGEEAKLAAALLGKLKGASKPAVLLGIEVQRYGLHAEAEALVRKLSLPWASTMLAKGVIPEETPGFVGVYGGENSIASVKKLVEGADALVALGCVFGRSHRKLVTGSGAKLHLAANHEVRSGRTVAGKASLRALLSEMQKAAWTADPAKLAGTAPAGLSFAERRKPLGSGATAAPGPGMSYDELLREVSDFLDESILVVTDTSLSSYPAAELQVRGRGSFLCNAVWNSIGYSVGAAVGAALAQPRRTLVICGDGGFQMTAQALSTMARRKMRSIVIVLDNGHYGIEQWLLAPGFFSRGASAPLKPYLELNRWDYAALAKALGFERASAPDTLDAFKAALREAKDAPGPVMIAARIKERDLPAQLAKGGG